MRLSKLQAIVLTSADEPKINDWFYKGFIIESIWERFS